MNNNDNPSQIETRANDILKHHNGVYLEKRLYAALKKEFPDLSRADFREVLNELLYEDYVLEHGLIKPMTDKNTKKSGANHVKGKRSGKGASKPQRVPGKREI
jgi:hypothetical protein